VMHHISWQAPLQPAAGDTWTRSSGETRLTRFPKTVMLCVKSEYEDGRGRKWAWRDIGAHVVMELV
jgi:hypothetical protein